uniref:Uncharacterized protein n=1 Tax=Romanomermis culicivorax TaxID=13658 RepID=A0A915L2L4_ROMCU
MDIVRVDPKIGLWRCSRVGLTVEILPITRRNLRCCGCRTYEHCTKGGGLGLQIGQSGWRKALRVEIGGEGFMAGGWMKIPGDVAVIYVLHGCSRIIGSIAPGAFLCAVMAARVVLAVAVEKRQIYWAAAPNFADGDQLKLCGGDSGPVISMCCGDGQNGD